MANPSEALATFCSEIGLAHDPDGPVLAAPIGEDATALAVRLGEDHRRLVCVDLTGDISKRVTLMRAPGADRAAIDAVAAAIIASGRAVTLIQDSPGFIAQRIVAMIANLGCYMAEIGLASPDDIDTAMRLGLNYPQGSIQLAAALGPARTLEILEQAQRITGEDRYRPTTWLRRRAMLGLAIHTPA